MHKFPIEVQHVDVVIQASGAVHSFEAEVDGHADINGEKGGVDEISILDLQDNEDSSIANIVGQGNNTFVILRDSQDLS